MSLDLSAMELPVDKAGKMTILHPVSKLPLKRSDGSEATLSLYSTDSPQYVAHQRELRKNALKRRGRQITAEEIEAELINQIIALCAGWSLATLDGRDMEVEFTPDNARIIFSNPKMSWLRKQAEEYVGDIANFATASASS